MASKRKKQKNKSVKQWSVTIAFLAVICRFIIWLIKQIYRHTCANACLVIGLFIFIISFGFFVVNALFSQMKTHQETLININLTSVSAVVEVSILSEKQARIQADSNIFSVFISSSLHQDLSLCFLQNTIPGNLLETQEKLAKIRLHSDLLDEVSDTNIRYTRV
ncbi:MULTISPECIES: hypothetical protein [unclassified Bartonella]|uniref:hypothetical protein n=1 Tax=unclassified Bartonella TaxID=2645622 RepID=UPI0012946C57|nr:MULTISPECIES: hypothetical protein [unclassified Bartonella]